MTTISELHKAKTTKVWVVEKNENGYQTPKETTLYDVLMSAQPNGVCRHKFEHKYGMYFVNGVEYRSKVEAENQLLHLLRSDYEWADEQMPYYPTLKLAQSFCEDFTNLQEWEEDYE